MVQPHHQSHSHTVQCPVLVSYTVRHINCRTQQHGTWFSGMLPLTHKLSPSRCFYIIGWHDNTQLQNDAEAGNYDVSQHIWWSTEFLIPGIMNLPTCTGSPKKSQLLVNWLMHLPNTASHRTYWLLFWYGMWMDSGQSNTSVCQSHLQMEMSMSDSLYDSKACNNTNNWKAAIHAKHCCLQHCW